MPSYSDNALGASNEIFNLFNQPTFFELLRHGKETGLVIARNDGQLLEHSIIELERFSVSINLIDIYALNLLTLLHMLPALSPPARASAFFPPSIPVS